LEKKREGEREGGREESSRQADGTIVLGLPDSGGRDVVLPKEILTGVHRDHKAAPNIGLQSTACAGEYGRKSKENSKKWAVRWRRTAQSPSGRAQAPPIQGGFCSGPPRSCSTEKFRSRGRGARSKKTEEEN